MSPPYATVMPMLCAECCNDSTTARTLALEQWIKKAGMKSRGNRMKERGKNAKSRNSVEITPSLKKRAVSISVITRSPEYASDCSMIQQRSGTRVIFERPRALRNQAHAQAFFPPGIGELCSALRHPSRLVLRQSNNVEQRERSVSSARRRWSCAIELLSAFGLCFLPRRGFLGRVLRW